MKGNGALVVYLMAQAVIASTGPDVVCPSQPLLASVSENVILQCHLVPPVDMRDMTVEWSHGHFNYTVLLYQDGKDNFKEENKTFTNRTSVSYQGLNKGDLSLRLFSVQLSDSGTYRCSIHIEKLQSSCYVNLSVAENKNNRSEHQQNTDWENNRKTEIIIYCVVGIVIILILIAVACRTEKGPECVAATCVEVCVEVSCAACVGL
uniref:Ig-like domain-containing protein n=1 Tax=Anabas testudineus TaxID=64144 RepID=A0A3Q1IH35_ANATE